MSYFIIILLFISFFIYLKFKNTSHSSLNFTISSFNNKFQTCQLNLFSSMGLKERKKLFLKKIKEQDKSLKKHLFVLNFDGDMKASNSHILSDIIHVLIPIVTKDDIVVCRIHSPGGLVPHYGFAASQLARLRAHCHLVASIDHIASSGGYMMAVVAHEIIAAPFAIVGSIGVVSQVPNFHRFLKKYDIDVEEHTAGESKRTLTMFGENNEKKREKYIKKLDDTHYLFKKHIHQYRPSIDLDTFADGDYFYAEQACRLLNNSMVDRIETLDDYIAQKSNQYRVWNIEINGKKSFVKKFLSQISKIFSLMRG